MSEEGNVIPIDSGYQSARASTDSGTSSGTNGGNKGGNKNAAGAGRGKGASRKPPTIDDGEFQDMFKRFTLIYPSDQVFDHHEKILARIGHLRHAFGKNVKRWLEHPMRDTVNLKNLIFDAQAAPGSDVPGVINLYDGLPLEPKKGDCQPIKDLLLYICKEQAVYDWVIRWIAYMIQNPGAKMQTAIIMHGEEGTGKSFFWRHVVAHMFGKYAGTIGQAELESAFNPWASQKLFLVAEEVVSRAELNSHKGKLKHLVTGDVIQINDKNVPLREEKNQANFVFLSNELQPNKLDRSDRRYCVIYTPPAAEPQFYQEVAECIRAGGVQAFLHELLAMDLTEFGPHTKPPMNEDKQELIEVSLSAEEHFFSSWQQDELDAPFMSCTTEQLYVLFQRWCNKSGYKFPPSMQRFSRQVDLLGRSKGLIKRQLPRLVGQVLKRGMFFVVGSPPAEVSQQDWLAQQEKAFQEYLDAR